MPADARAELNAVTDYIKHWTQRELAKLQHLERKPICIPISNGYKIGLYELSLNSNKTCNVLNSNKELVHTFDNKINAVLYTMYTIKNQLKTADEILHLDSEINKHYTDIQALRRRQDVARANKEFDIVDIRQARLEMMSKQLEMARDKLLKIRLHAKYNKVWMD